MEVGYDIVECICSGVTWVKRFTALQLWPRSMAEPRTSTDAYRFNHCLPSIARKAEKSEAARLAKRIA